MSTNKKKKDLQKAAQTMSFKEWSNYKNGIDEEDIAPIKTVVPKMSEAQRQAIIDRRVNDVVEAANDRLLSQKQKSSSVSTQQMLNVGKGAISEQKYNQLLEEAPLGIGKNKVTNYGAPLTNIAQGLYERANRIETTQAIFDKYGKYYNSPDYKEYSEKGAAIENPTMSWLDFFGRRPIEKEIGNIVTYSRDNIAQLMAAEVGGMAGSAKVKLLGNSKFRYMTDFEVGIYNYLLAKNGKDAAQEFLDDIEETLTAREGGMIAENIQNSDAVTSAILHGELSIFSGVNSYATGIKQLFSEEALPTTSLEFANQELLNDLDGFAEKAYQAGNTIGNMLPSMVAGYGNPVLYRILQGSSAAGNAYRQARQEGKPNDEAAAFGVMMGGMEYVTSSLLDGISGATGSLPKKALQKISMLSNALVRVGAKYAISIGSEITEEELQLWLEPFVRKVAFGEDYDAPTIEEMADTAIITAISTGILNSGSDIATGNLTKVNGLTPHEATVINNVYEQRLAEESENRTLSKRDKDKLYDRVVEEVKRGYVSTDEIERILGGKTYEGYKSLIEKKNSLEERKTAIENEIKDLVKTPESQFTVEQREKLTSLREEAKGIKEELQNLGIKTAKNNLFNEVNKLTSKDTYLRESYNDLIRQTQDIQIDENQYKGTKFEDAAKKTIENARKAGASNSIKVRDFVEFSAKYSSVSGTVVDFKSDNEIKSMLEQQLNSQITKLSKSTTEADKAKLARLQEKLKQVQEGEIKVNGVKTKDGVAININSSNYLNTVLGHEVTHFLENKKAYEALQKAAFKYAKTKGDYEGRREVLEALYDGIDGTSVDYELTADLVGDYLFTEYDFIKSLSTENRNVFQYVFDQIKYMYKLATAGSKEARELEKVMHNFEKALRETAEVSQNTQYHISKNIENFDNSWYNEIELPTLERDRVQSEALIWHAENKGQPFSMPLSNGFTYLCCLDNDGIVHIYGKEESVNIHEFGGNYDNRNTERPDRYVEKFGNQQGIDIGDNVFDENGQEQIAPVASNGATVQGKGRSNRTGYYENDTYANRKPKGWHFNDDGSTEVTYSDGTKTIEDIAPIKEVSSDDDAFFDGEKKQFSLSADPKKADADYMFAVKNGDTETAQKMVDEAAKNAGYAVRAYHGTPDARVGYKKDSFFTVFDHSKSNAREVFGVAHYFTTNNDLAKFYGGKDRQRKYSEPKVYDTFLNLGNSLVVECNGANWNHIPIPEGIPKRVDHDGRWEMKEFDYANTDYITKKAKELGYDSVTFVDVVDGIADYDRFRGDVYAVFDSNQIKSADPVTYDDNGNVIPLSERFNTENEDIRYSLSKSSLDNETDLVYNVNDDVKRGDGYVRTVEFRKLQAESQRMSDEESKLYHSGSKQIDDEVRGRLSRTFGLELRSANSERIYSIRTLLNPKTNNNVNIYEGVDGSLFHDCFEISRKYLRNGELVDLHEVKTTEDGIGYDDCDNYLSEDGLSGFSITPDGDLISVFNLNAEKGFLKTIAPLVKEKAKTLDCYASPNQNLMAMYEKIFGFKTAAVMDYNMEYDHDDIAQNHNMPKVAFMVNTESDVETKYFTKDEYDEAKAYRDSFVNQTTDNDIAPVKNSLYYEGANRALGGSYRFDGKDFRVKSEQDIAPVAEGDTPKTYGNYNIFGNDVMLESTPTQESVTTPQEDVAEETPIQEDVAPIMEAPIAETAKPKKRKPSKASLVRYTKKQAAQYHNLQGAYNLDGKQYISDGIFVAEFDAIDEKLEHNEKFPIERLQSFLNTAIEGQSTEKYAIDFDKIVEINKATKGDKNNKSFITVDGVPFDSKYVEAVMRAIENPTFAVSPYRGGVKTLVAVGDNGRAMLMPVRAGDKLTAAYEAQPITEAIAPTTAEDATAAEVNQQGVESIEHIADDFAPFVKPDEDTISDDFAPTTQNIAHAENFQKRIESWDGITEGFAFVVGDTPSYLSKLEVMGKKVGNKQVRIDATKIKNIMKDHPEMTKDVIKNLPDLLNDPILVLDSKTVPGRLVLLGEVYANGKPVMMALELNPTTRSGKSTYVNVIKVASAYARQNVQNMISTSTIRYINKNKSRVGDWLKVNRLQLPLPNSQSNSANVSISETMPNVNSNSEKSSDIAPVAKTKVSAEAPTAKPQKSVGAATYGFDPITQLQFEYGTIPEGENPVRDDSMPKSTNGKDKVSLTARTVKGAEVTPDELVDLLDKETVGGRFSYIPIKNSDTVRKAYDEIAKKGWEVARGEWEARVRRGEVSAELTATGELLLNNAAKAGDRETWLNVLSNYQLMGTNAGQAIQAMRILKTLNPDDSLYMIERSVEQMVKDMNLGTEIVIDEKLKRAYLEAETDTERNVARKKLVKDIAKQIPSTAKEKWTALRYLNMLGNVRTQGKNILGNVGMAVTSRIKNTVAASIEAIAEKVSGGKFHKTKSLFVSKDLLKSARNDFANVEHIALNGGKFNDSMASSTQFQQEIQDARKIFSGVFAPVEWYRRVTNQAMNTGDLIFSKAAYGRALAGYLKANGIKETDFSKIAPKTLDEARAYAVKEAQESTFRDNNWLSNWVSKIGRRKDTPKIGKLLSEGIMPFRKTPANILLRAEEYSPLGIVNATVKSIQAVKGAENVTGADVVNSWAKTLTGTGLFALGMWLNNSGALSGGPDEDDDKEWFEDQYGWQNYSIQIGDHNLTIDFLSPSAMSLLMGAQLNELRQNGDIELKDLESALLSLADPMIEMSMLQGVNDTLDNIRYAENNMGQFLVNACVSYLTQGLTNSLLGQIERSLEKQRMTTYVDKNSDTPAWLQKALGKASAKTPGWDYQQIPYVDAWGEIEDIAPIPALVENMLSPSYISEGISDEVYEELNRLNDAQSDINVYPQTPDKTVTFDDAYGNRHENYNLSADEYVELAQLQGQTQKKLVEEILSNNQYSELTDQEKAKAVQLAYQYAREYGRQEVLSANGFSAKWMAEADDDIVNAIIAHTNEERTFAHDYPERYKFFNDNGISYNTYKSADEDGKRAYTWAYDNPGKFTMSKAISDDFLEYYNLRSTMEAFDAKDENGETVSGLKKERVTEYINGLDLDYGQRLILYRSMYSSKEDRNNYNADIVEYLNNRDDISYEEMVTILKELDMTVDSNGNVDWD